MKCGARKVWCFLVVATLLALLAGCRGQEYRGVDDQPPQETAVGEDLAPAATRPSGSRPSTTAGAVASEEASADSDRGNADVLYVVARQQAPERWQFTVTVEHPDRGWDDYADGWDVVLPDGSVARPDPKSAYTRLLLHPHENEQPFTRSQGNIPIPAHVVQVTVRAHDLVDGFGGREVIVDLTGSKGEYFEVERLDG